MNVEKLKKMKGKEKIVMVTAYDAPSARIARDAGIDVILVGDSLGNNVLGYENTIPVTMEEMLIHVAAVKRGAPDAFIVADMPFLSYQTSVEKAVENAGKFLKVGANAVKIEGGEEFGELVQKLVESGIPVMGHIGLTPQFVNRFGGYRVQGKTEKNREYLLRSAKELEKRGAFAIVLELIVEEVAKEITESVSIPTIGIGSGRFCDGQVLVWHDLLGLNPDFVPRFSKKYANLYEVILKALQDFRREVKEGLFPTEEHSFTDKSKGGVSS
ncbi:3-methyl-2-oxobutanoate hydroxymethyltransferase [Thermotoga sp. 38H-to]|uniref:3-methyl-2-oxobutanoate hydroxymethyltransferase n=1 Tax=Thermotoga sp. 38H-to TaxID=1755812 RepID=UPI0013EA1958|nr:3-methyl-2-oxobutanoate hydroxymethyltransferase [Thermotoga sp. 38H-to]KAF2960656.1 3-methyl-2-oxobutanoate hydroxymethyltransferase [Thermotoga sp. 38H-to]